MKTERTFRVCLLSTSSASGRVYTWAPSNSSTLAEWHEVTCTLAELADKISDLTERFAGQRWSTRDAELCAPYPRLHPDHPMYDCVAVFVDVADGRRRPPGFKELCRSLRRTTWPWPKEAAA